MDCVPLFLSPMDLCIALSVRPHVTVSQTLPTDVTWCVLPVTETCVPGP